MICYISDLHFSGPDPVCFGDREYEDPSIPFSAGPGRGYYLFNDHCFLVIPDDNLHKDFRDEIDIENSATELEMDSPLAPASTYRGTGHSRDLNGKKCFLNIGHPFFPYNCPDNFHKRSPDTILLCRTSSSWEYSSVYSLIGSHFVVVLNTVVVMRVLVSERSSPAGVWLSGTVISMGRKLLS